MSCISTNWIIFFKFPKAIWKSFFSTDRAKTVNTSVSFLLSNHLKLAFLVPLTSFSYKELIKKLNMMWYWTKTLDDWKYSISFSFRNSFWSWILVGFFCNALKHTYLRVALKTRVFGRYFCRSEKFTFVHYGLIFWKVFCF